MDESVFWIKECDGSCVDSQEGQCEACAYAEMALAVRRAEDAEFYRLHASREGAYAPPYGPPAENKSRGQLDYEHDVRMNPYYHDGRPRKTWDQLSNIERWSWELDRYRNGRP